MRKEIIKKIRNKMIKAIWEQKKAEWDMSDLAFMFGLSVPQVYRILAEEKRSKHINKNNNKK